MEIYGNRKSYLQRNNKISEWKIIQSFIVHHKEIPGVGQLVLKCVLIHIVICNEGNLEEGVVGCIIVYMIV